MAHEFMAITPIGEDTLLICDQCSYSANRQIATFRKRHSDRYGCGSRQLKKSIRPTSPRLPLWHEFLAFPKAKRPRRSFLMADIDQPDGSTKKQFVFCVVRGDMELNETKLTNAIKARVLRPATIDEIHAVGAEAGYGSPVGIKREQVLLVVDDLVATSPNLVAGANRVDWHLRNINYGRDYKADIVTDIVAAADGHPCINVAARCAPVRGVEVGNIFKLGTSTARRWAPPISTKMAKRSRL